jgi:hypothetical protein
MASESPAVLARDVAHEPSVARSPRGMTGTPGRDAGPGVSAAWPLVHQPHPSRPEAARPPLEARDPPAGLPAA